MATIAADKKKYTYADYLKSPDDERYELIEGDMLMTPSPVQKHQKISRELTFELLKFVKGDDLGEVYYAPFDVHLDNENVVQPDILFISKERQSIIGEKNIHGAPDLVIEIISESTAYRDFVQKKKLYAKHGVKEYWIVIPDEGSIEIFVLQDNTYVSHRTYGKDALLESPGIKGLRIELKNIF